MPRRVDHDERRREITYAVWLLMATRGPEAVTLRSVAAEAGISVGRIQHYFASKDELVRHGCRALVESAADAFDGSVDDDGVPTRGGASAEGVDPLATLRRLITRAVPATEPFRIGTAVWVAYLAMSIGDAEIARVVAEAKRGQEDLAVRLLEAAGAAGVVRRGIDARTVARRLIATADGLATRVLTGDLPAETALALLDGDLGDLVRGTI